ncbi:MAG: nucleotide exchange factor GrpE [Polyangiaceae bacterium]|nr:nucleotide exchange factor GrpE [Polyangiaceae bacterium]
MSQADDGSKDGTGFEDGPQGGGAAAGEGEVTFAEPELVEPDPLEVAKAEAQKFREQLLRTAADFDNFRKRSRREVEDASRKGKETTVKELLPVFDNLERALTSADNAPDVKSVADGLRMIVRQFGTTLEKIGIKRVQSVGKPFDPSQHEAIQQIESAEVPPGCVVAEVQPGYMLGDQLLRAAMVVVSKGAPGGEESPGEEPAN